MVRECYHKINSINHGMYKWGEGEDDKKIMGLSRPSSLT
jgi:hypothetical protein